ncbi:MAG: tryptophan--tRNA ligase [Candidatus Moranbacteria bacterium]|nr:tryptophan--tRNA ligase [Candidatus Moranbacteria bacterium]MDD3965274.1 tryptophan--tRNA ligase [Candidatus Moranbacteria bacterium]
MKQRIFSGIQPSGNLHLGNYLGAIAQWLTLQDEYDTLFCIVDLHAITVPQDPEALRKKTLEIAKIYLASGIDPSKSTLFVQSHVKEHTELGWILNTIARFGDLEKMTQFKDKSVKSDKETVGIGLFDYPVLMASDILLYDTHVVPVGKDQMQHVELTRTLAKRFNERFGETFVVPEGRVSKEGQLIMALDDETKKMSKSAVSEYNFIALTDDADTVRRKIRKAVTDGESEVVYSDEKPALKNLINIYTLLSQKTSEEIEILYRGKGYGDFKTDLAEVIVNFLTPFQERLAHISDEEVLSILHAGAEKARGLAQKKMQSVRKNIGFLVE